MTIDSTSGNFVGSIPEHYDRGLGPVIFADFAAEMARRATARPVKRMLEIAAGTGIVTRQLRDRLPAEAMLTATDLNPPMLEVARRKFRPDERVDFEPADATALPFQDGCFDAVVCQFGVMFFPDKAKSYREVHRVLALDGRYHFSGGTHTAPIRSGGSWMSLWDVCFQPTRRRFIACRSAIT